MGTPVYGSCGACGWRIITRNRRCTNPECPTKGAKS